MRANGKVKVDATAAAAAGLTTRETSRAADETTASTSPCGPPGAGAAAGGCGAAGALAAGAGSAGGGWTGPATSGGVVGAGSLDG
jgi:hypothetical protein